MAHVIVLDSLNKDVFVCGICKSVYYDLEGFLDHKTLQCKVAPGMFKNDEVAPTTSEIITANISAVITEPTVHQENCTTIQPQLFPTTSRFSCSECGKIFKNTKTLRAHMKSHEIKPYQCLVCGRCFMQSSHLKRHVLSHKVWPESLSETTAKSSEDDLLSYSCPYCNVVFANYNIFRSHLKNHQTMKKYKCIQDNCIYFFETVESLLHHVSTDHITAMYTCYICKNTFDSLESIATHQLSHSNFTKELTPVKQYKCLQCDAVFKKPEKLTLHMLTESHNKICIHCNKTFASDKRLRLHLQTHRKIKPYHCNICNSSFNMKKYLTNHMLKHGKKEFKCHVCKNMFMRRDLLQRHMKSHQSGKLIRCPYKNVLNCKREFSRQDKLKLHLKSHANIISVECKNVDVIGQSCTTAE